MNNKLKKINTIATLAALGVALIIGFLIPDFASKIKFFGDWYIQSLKVVISPVIFLSMSLFVLQREKGQKFIIGKAILIFIIMFVVTFLMASLVFWIFQPGAGFESGSSTPIGSQADFSIDKILLNLLPKSFEDFFYGKCVFFVIVVALLVAFIISFTPIKEKCAAGLTFCKKYVDLILKAIIFLTPLAVLSLVSNMIANYDVETFTMSIKYVLFAYGLSLATILLVMILPVWIIAKVNPITYIRKVARVWLMSISTCSSVATLPYTIKCCNESFGVDEKITNVVVPLGCTIHMCGGAISFSLLGFFVAQLNGVTMTLPMFMLMLLSSVLINMAAPGIPGGGVVIGFTYLNIFGFELESFYGLYAAMYKLLDMSYTTLNVTGDISANILLNHFEEKKRKKLETKAIENKLEQNN